MTEINFKSTYKIPVSQWGVNNTKKLEFKSLIGSFGGDIFGKGRDSYALLSIPDDKDMKLLRRLKKLGYFQILKFPGEKIPKKDIEAYVKKMILERKK